MCFDLETPNAAMGRGERVSLAGLAGLANALKNVLQSECQSGQRILMLGV